MSHKENVMNTLLSVLSLRIIFIENIIGGTLNSISGKSCLPFTLNKLSWEMHESICS